MKIVKRLINPAIQSLHAYHVPPAAGLMKLDAMENPYHWPDELKQKWLAEIENIEINRYPDPSASVLKEKIRNVMGIKKDLSIMLGNGSDEIIQIIAMALAKPERCFMTPEPGFVMYQQISRMLSVDFKAVALNADDFSLARENTLATIEKEQPVLLFIAYPNNPTGNLFDREMIIEMIKKSPGLVVIDEAYHSFAGESFIDQVDEFENLLVMRTLSKSGLAGLRLGYLVGHKEWLQEFEKIRLPYNINSLTQKSTEFILDHYEVLEMQARQICNSREKLFTSLRETGGVKVWPSVANFILFRTLQGNAGDIHNRLKENGVLIKNLHGSHPSLDNCLRVTVGTDNENAEFLKQLQKLL